jgi:hypothetical protein
MGLNHDQRVKEEIASNRPVKARKASKAKLAAVVEAIRLQLDKVEWTPDTLNNIADILNMSGFPVRDTN